MANKKSLDIKDQLLLLKRRGLNFKDERQAEEWLSKVSYYRLKGYWWQMQDDFVNHHFASGWYFFASFLKALLISASVADLETPKTS